MHTKSTLGRAGLIAAVTAVPVALGIRFARLYRARAGFPRRSPILHDPTFLGLGFETWTLEGQGGPLPAWWIPATTRDGRPRKRPVPAVVLVHGWESARDRTLPNAAFLHAAGFHVLTLDVRGHGVNPDEALPITAGEFGADALAGIRALHGRADVSAIAILGHSLGAIGALIAAAADPDVAAVVATSTPADPLRLTRQTFRIAHLPIPGPVAWPLAWITAKVFVGPRGHRLADISATEAVARYAGPLLLVHGSDDDVIPVGHMARLEAAARRARAMDPDTAVVETLVVEGGRHSWLYESSEYRGTIARFLARLPGAPLGPDGAAAAAIAVDARRLPGNDDPFAMAWAGEADATGRGTIAATLGAAIPSDAAD